MTAMRITDRDQVQAGDVVTYGALGYHHRNTVHPDEDGGLYVRSGGSWYSDFMYADRYAPTGFYIGSTQRVGGIHAARPDTMFEDGFARALCRSTLWVLVNHEGADDTPVLAAHPDSLWQPGTETPSCLRCCAALERLARDV